MRKFNHEDAKKDIAMDSKGFDADAHIVMVTVIVVRRSKGVNRETVHKQLSQPLTMTRQKKMHLINSYKVKYVSV